MNLSKCFKISDTLRHVIGLDEEAMTNYVRPYSIDEELDYTLKFSDNADKVLSSIYHLHFHLSKHRDDRDPIIDKINSSTYEISEERWYVLFQMGHSVMREAIHLLQYLDSPPIQCFKRCVDMIKKDQYAVDYLCELWIQKKWDLYYHMIMIFQNSIHAWRFIAKLNIDEYSTSKEVLKRIVQKSRCRTEKQMYFHFITLLEINPSCITYLEMLDNINAFGIQTTIDSINYFNLWKHILCNEGAEDIIDHIIEDPCIINDKNVLLCRSFREWFVPLVETNPLANKYITKKDLDNDYHTDKIFCNPCMADILLDWINLDSVDEHNADGLITMTLSVNDLDMLDRIWGSIVMAKYPDGKKIVTAIDEDCWLYILSNKLNYQFVVDILNYLSEKNLLERVLTGSMMIPYWSEIDRTHELTNLTKYTLQYLNDDLIEDIILYPHLLTYRNWKVLFTTRFGVEVGMSNIILLAEKGALHMLFESNHLTQDELVKLLEDPEVVEVCTDEELFAILNREDIIQPDLNEISVHKYEVHQELLMVWHDPDRLIRLANKNNMDMYSYMKLT